MRERKIRKARVETALKVSLPPVSGLELKAQLAGERAAEANAGLVLWCVHTLGPDEVAAAPSYRAAVASAAEINRAVFRRIADEGAPNDVLCFSYAAPWPHSAESHAEDLAKLRESGGDEVTG